MATELFIHKMSEHMDTARIIRWLVNEGDPVQRGQIVMEVETDKAVAELEAPATGVLKGIREGAVDGADIPVGETIAYIAQPGETVPLLPALGAQPSSAHAPAEDIHRHAPPVTQTPAPAGEQSGLRATPAARRVAKELGVDLGRVKGTGPDGRISEDDVRAFVSPD